MVRITLATTSVKRAVPKLVEAAQELADRLGVPNSEIALGGRSFGGRCASVAHTEGFAVHSLALLSYPLHPAGKPENLRVDHFPKITAPTLFVSGDRDPFGSPEEFADHVGAIAGPVTTEWVKGAHSPNSDDEVLDRLRRWWGLD